MLNWILIVVNWREFLRRNISISESDSEQIARSWNFKPVFITGGETFARIFFPCSCVFILPHSDSEAKQERKLDIFVQRTGAPDEGHLFLGSWTRSVIKSKRTGRNSISFLSSAAPPSFVHRRSVVVRQYIFRNSLFGKHSAVDWWAHPVCTRPSFVLRHGIESQTERRTVIFIHGKCLALQSSKATVNERYFCWNIATGRRRCRRSRCLWFL